MPEARPGNTHIVSAFTKATLHGAPCIEELVAGVAVKQAAAPAGTGLGDALITTIQIGERGLIICKGRVLIANTGSWTRASQLYIKLADNTLDDSSGLGFVKYGQVVEVAGERGVPVGFCRVDLDLKSNF